MYTRFVGSEATKKANVKTVQTVQELAMHPNLQGMLLTDHKESQSVIQLLHIITIRRNYAK